MELNYAIKTAYGKIVYYGPALSGKTTNLEKMFDLLTPSQRKTQKVQLVPTANDRTLFFDFMPFSLGKVGIFDVTLGVYTVPGQSFHYATRKIVLTGAKAVVFVADSQVEMRQPNIEALLELKGYMLENNMRYEETPVVWQFNKRDLPNVMSVEEMCLDLSHTNEIVIPASVITGVGVAETMRDISRALIRKYIPKTGSSAVETLGSGEHSATPMPRAADLSSVAAREPVEKDESLTLV